ncbi:MAG: O-antigen ligase family protein [Acidobacteria bacterium]|nr:O-antigen ligase family protein [Acidobacteriota bacterium]
MRSTTPAAAAALRDAAGWPVLLLFGIALPLSIAVSQIFLAVLAVLWLAAGAPYAVRPPAPAFFRPLAAYAAWTLLASVPFSLAPGTSLVESREVLLFLIVPVVHSLAQGARARTVVSAVLAAGVAAAAIGIAQYGFFDYDHLGQRPQGSMGHYMTYAGVLMLLAGAALARLLFEAHDRAWPLAALSAFAVALVVTLTRSAWIGATIGAGLLLVLRDRRLLAFAPVAVALFMALAPPPVVNRVYSTFDLDDPTNRDRLAMLTVGAGMVRDHPLTGVGPGLVEAAYDEYRPENAVNVSNPHLHNVPLQIAAERGLPALALWVWFLAAVTADLVRRLRDPASRALAAAGLASLAAMLAAGMFEYNFGDSEFLMLLLVLVTLPGAAATNPAPRNT